MFCGIGGFHYAAESFGLECVFACDINENACRQHERNFGLCPAGDITHIEAESIPDHDLLIAGFPCQPFSIIGKRQGMNDRRGSLIKEIVRVLAAKQPHAFVLENVRQMITDNKGRTTQTMQSILTDAGYECKVKVLNALDFGLPQKRERAIIVGMRSGLESFQWPKSRPLRRTLSQILERPPEKRHFVSEHIRKKRQASHTASIVPSIWRENKGDNVNSHPFSRALRANASYNYLLVNGERRLTPGEQLRLQGFPEKFEIIGSDSQIRKQTGNAVPVPMIRAVIGEVLVAAG